MIRLNKMTKKNTTAIEFTRSDVKRGKKTRKMPNPIDIHMIQRVQRGTNRPVGKRKKERTRIVRLMVSKREETCPATAGPNHWLKRTPFERIPGPKPSSMSETSSAIQSSDLRQRSTAATA